MQTKFAQLCKELEGKKTHLVALTLFVYNIVYVGWGQGNWQSAVDGALGALGLSALRSGVSKVLVSSLTKGQ